MKNIVELKNDMLEVFEPLTVAELYNFNVKDLGELVVVDAEQKYLENEKVLVYADRFYNLNKVDFNKFRIDACNDRYYTYKDYHPFKTLYDAIEFAERCDDVIVITRDIFKDNDGDFTDILYYAVNLQA